MKRSVKNKIDPYPCMARGETEFEEKRIEAEFELIFKRIPDLYMSSFKDTYEYAFRAGYVTGKIAGKRESLGSPSTETLNTSPQDASVRETAGAIKEQQHGITTSD